MNPTAFTLFGIDVKWYGVIIAFAFSVALFLTFRESRRIGFKDDTLLDCLLVVMPVGIICARIYYVVFSLDEFNNIFDMINIRNGGLAIHGGVLGGVLAGILFCKRRNISFWQVVDIVIPSVILAQGIGRWGNFVNQEVYGGPTNLPWGITIYNMPGKYHPLFLYEFILNVLIYLFLVWYRKNKRKNEGEVFSLYLILYGIVRFFLERMRVTEYVLETNFLKIMGINSVAQLVSLGMILTGIIIFIFLRKKDKIFK